MPPIRFSLALGCTLGLLASAAHAQTATIVRPVQAQSYMTGSSIGVQIVPALSTDPLRLHIRDTGTVQSTSPDPVREWTGTGGANFPDFTPTALFEHWASQALAVSSWDPAVPGAPSRARRILHRRGHHSPDQCPG